MKNVGKLTALFLSSVMMITITGCGGGLDTGITESGKIEGQTYTNQKLHFSYTFPDNWELFNAEETLDHQRETMKKVFGSSENFEKSMKQGHMEYPLYAETEDGEMKANLLIQIVPVTALKNASVEEYANSLAKEFVDQYKQAGGTAEITPAKVQTISGREVARADGSVVLDGTVYGKKIKNTTIYQSYTIFRESNSVVVTMLSAYNDDQLLQGGNTLDSLSFTDTK